MLTAAQIRLIQSGPVIRATIGITPDLERLLRSSGDRVPSPEDVDAMIDTGATHTVVREEVIARLLLPPVGQVPVNTPSAASVYCFQYRVRLTLPRGFSRDWTVIGASLKNQPIHCLIGRDVLSHAVFNYDGKAGLFRLAF